MSNLVVYYHKDKGAWKETHSDESFAKVVEDKITIFKNPPISDLAQDTPPEFWIWDGKKFEALPRRKQKYRLQANSVRYTEPTPIVKKSYNSLILIALGVIILGLVLSCLDITVAVKPEVLDLVRSINE